MNLIGVRAVKTGDITFVFEFIIFEHVVVRLDPDDIGDPGDCIYSPLPRSASVRIGPWEHPIRIRVHNQSVTFSTEYSALGYKSSVDVEVAAGNCMEAFQQHIDAIY